RRGLADGSPEPGWRLGVRKGRYTLQPGRKRPGPGGLVRRRAVWPAHPSRGLGTGTALAGGGESSGPPLRARPHRLLLREALVLRKGLSPGLDRGGACATLLHRGIGGGGIRSESPAEGLTGGLVTAGAEAGAAAGGAGTAGIDGAGGGGMAGAAGAWLSGGGAGMPSLGGALAAGGSGVRAG